MSQYPNIFTCNLKMSTYNQNPEGYTNSYLQSSVKPFVSSRT